MKAVPFILGLGLFAAQACRSETARPSAPKPTPPEAAPASPPRPTPSPVPATSATAATAEPEARPSPHAFTRVFDGRVQSFALGKAGRAVILTNGRGRLFDGTRWQSIEPELDASAGAHLEVFFGRDNEPRLMGYTALESGAGYQKRYLRHRRGAWQPALDEIGPLGGAKGALYGVLGHDDPEVVCLTGLSCIVKRVSGWKTVSAHPAPARVLLGGGSAWALHRDRIERLDESDQKQIRWVELTPERAWDEPSGLWDEPGGAPWVLEEKNDVLYQLIDGQWRKTRSEVRGPKALAGPSRDDLWLVGTGGAAHFDGRAWSSVPEVLGPLAFVVVAKNEIWLAGASGVFRGAPAGT